jgi:nicotinic acid mononucleotide adenylyltransferase
VSRVGVYPGSFNPPTVAHLAIAEAALRQRRLDRIELVVSRVTLAKEHIELPLVEHRIEVLERTARRVPWLAVRVTEAQLLADIAAGYDVVVMGADKWTQIQDVRWYGDAADRDEALARLPELAVVPRPPHVVPPEHTLEVPPELASVSSTAVRSGALELMTPEARAFADRTGAWIDEARYRAWLEG